ncbi:hypothetical protein MVEN_01593500 [Mycena venus]|uniref:Uncharacterized protein n=1 Tax=Mycena venus TaxID=2733690 RepID=A0A8H7CSD7_9AGAR|nr:hypothetical protein MVEN_01593500 [Mycena venus]
MRHRRRHVPPLPSTAVILSASRRVVLDGPAVYSRSPPVWSQTALPLSFSDATRAPSMPSSPIFGASTFPHSTALVPRSDSMGGLLAFYFTLAVAVLCCTSFDATGASSMLSSPNFGAFTLLLLLLSYGFSPLFCLIAECNLQAVLIHHCRNIIRAIRRDPERLQTRQRPHPRLRILDAGSRDASVSSHSEYDGV